ncbi:hypothetical protein MIND_01304300 [Mycena indigotica]|uniref:Uncharacterized protein n=1 Tax=Mycena indigotica TaxID=2126181 RepID=A0A8H6S1S3_9AGAR|nr:uncharacterized protein MIND_01304300 [Mycena indigotica]KAF7290640.1 hypothetical protein MIND_01304300 [Mycena indigotica]
MKFSTNNSLLTVATVLLAFSASASAHAISIPALGIQGTGQRSDVQRPSNANPCGKINIAKNLDSSPAVAAAADGSVTIKMKAFNPGADGSLQVAVRVNADGKGKNFVAGTVTKNGNPKPKVGDVDTVVFKLPPGTKCTGGAKKNRCLVSVKSTRGFGSCAVVTQGGKGKRGSPDFGLVQASARRGNRAAVVALARAVAREEEMLEDGHEDDVPAGVDGDASIASVHEDDLLADVDDDDLESVDADDEE